jgi:hypothetical protein
MPNRPAPTASAALRPLGQRGARRGNPSYSSDGECNATHDRSSCERRSG